jgi:hypothetical protein
MSTKRKWTKEEEELLVKTVKANFHNLTSAFEEVANSTGRSKKAVRLHWYNKTRLTSTCFVAVSQDTKMRNSKNYVPNCGHTKTPSTSNKTLWEKLKALLEWK